MNWIKIDNTVLQGLKSKVWYHVWSITESGYGFESIAEYGGDGEFYLLTIESDEMTTFDEIGCKVTHFAELTTLGRPE